MKCKIRGVMPENKQYMRINPATSQWGLFGLNLVTEKTREIIITEGEFDAMAAYQATGIPSISLPNGVSGLPNQCIEYLEQFDKIYLWMDNDEAGRLNQPKVAEKLGLNRTYLVNITEKGLKDANDVLMFNPDLLKVYIQNSRTIPDKNILKFSDIRQQVLNRIEKFDLNQGLPSISFDFYNKKIKGLRKGEMTILTGGTGSGKTTFLSQLSLDFCKQGAATLWGSFEIKNEILATNMILQLSGVNLYKETDKYEYWADQFEKMPMHFLTFFGSQNIEQVLHTIEYSIYSYQISHVVIDNLQFLLGTQARGFEKFDLQDRTIEQFRQLATRCDIHLTIVIHPKKVDEKEDLNISSVFGSAKATQEADNVLIIQNREKYRVLEIKKNRFDGEIGKAALVFDKTTKRFLELNVSEVHQLLEGTQNVNQIIDKVNIQKQQNGTNISQAKQQTTIQNEVKLQKEQTINAMELDFKLKNQRQERLSSLYDDVEKRPLYSDPKFHTEPSKTKQPINHLKNEEEFDNDLSEPLFKYDNKQDITKKTTKSSFFEEGEQMDVIEIENALKGTTNFKNNYIKCQVPEEALQNNEQEEELLNLMDYQLRDKSKRID